MLPEFVVAWLGDVDGIATSILSPLAAHPASTQRQTAATGPTPRIFVPPLGGNHSPSRIPAAAWQWTTARQNGPAGFADNSFRLAPCRTAGFRRSWWFSFAR